MNVALFFVRYYALGHLFFTNLPCRTAVINSNVLIEDPV